VTQEEKLLDLQIKILELFKMQNQILKLLSTPVCIAEDQGLKFRFKKDLDTP
jgi:hypothetical protein